MPATTTAGAPALDADSQAFLDYARGGDARHLERLLREHADRAYTQARHLLGSSADAEDAVQEAYLQLLRQAPRYDGACPFIAWLSRHVHLSALTIARSRSRRQAREREAVARQPPPPPERDRDLPEAVLALLSHLPERDRSALVLAYLSGLDQQGAARALGIRSDALGMRLCRARERVRALLMHRGYPATSELISGALVLCRQQLAPPAVHERARHLLHLVHGGQVLPATIVAGASLSGLTLLLMSVLATALLGGVAALVALHAPITLRPVAESPGPNSARATPAASAITGTSDDALRAPFELIPGSSQGRPIISPDGGILAIRSGESGTELRLYATRSLLRQRGVPLLQRTITISAPQLVAGALPPNHEFGDPVAFSGDGAQLLLATSAGMQLISPTATLPAGRGLDVSARPFMNSLDGRNWSVISDPQGDGTATLHWLQLPAAMFGQLLTPRLYPLSARLARDGKAILATTPDGALVRIDQHGAGVIEMSTAQAAALIGKPIERIELVSEDQDGSLMVAAWRPYPEALRNTFGTYVPRDDEAPEHGRNPGSAEPGPVMPRYLLRLEHGHAQLLRRISLARDMDALLVASSADGTRLATLQLVHGLTSATDPQLHPEGVQGDLHFFLGTASAQGHQDHDLGLGPLDAKTAQDAPPLRARSHVTFALISTAPDASSLVILIAERLANRARYTFCRCDTRTWTMRVLGTPAEPVTTLPAAELAPELMAVSLSLRLVAITLLADADPRFPQGTLLLTIPQE